MADQPRLDPEQEEAVRRLLAEARHDQPVPTDVADRLDRVLAGLSREADTPAVIDLASRRRRRNAGRLLVAAAAVIVAGVGVGQVIGTGSDSDDAGNTPSAAEGEAPPREADGEADARADAGSDAGGSADEGAPAQDGGSTAAPPFQATADGLPLQLSSEQFARDVKKGVTGLPPEAASLAEIGEAVPTFDCPAAAPYGDGTLVAAYYDGVPAVLALRPAEGTDQLAELLECGTAERIRAFNLRGP